MEEFFTKRKLNGKIENTLKYKGRPSKIWKADKAEICDLILNVVFDYEKQGFKLTLRQLYYQLVSLDAIPNHIVVYKKLGKIVDDLKYSGMLDWDSMEDRGRKPWLPYYNVDVVDALNDAKKQFRLNRQFDQNTIVEVWTEKDAISGILKRVTSKYHVNLVVNKGYSSSTAMYQSYRRFLKYILDGKKVVVLYFGDHDPSGLDMVRDIKERIMFFLTRGDELKIYDGKMKEWWDNGRYTVYDVDRYNEKYEGVANLAKQEDKNLEVKFDIGSREMYILEEGLFMVEQIGLTMDQIKEFNPPPNFAKMTDPRASDYVKVFGEISWEVDAIKPQNMMNIVEVAIRNVIDIDQYDKVMDKEKKDREYLGKIVDSEKNKLE